MRASCTRFAAPSLAANDRRCHSKVLGLRCSRFAILAVSRPSPRCASTSRSRSVSTDHGPKSLDSASTNWGPFERCRSGRRSNAARGWQITINVSAAGSSESIGWKIAHRQVPFTIPMRATGCCVSRTERPYASRSSATSVGRTSCQVLPTKSPCLGLRNCCAARLAKRNRPALFVTTTLLPTYCVSASHQM